MRAAVSRPQACAASRSTASRRSSPPSARSASTVSTTRGRRTSRRRRRRRPARRRSAPARVPRRRARRRAAPGRVEDHLADVDRASTPSTSAWWVLVSSANRPPTGPRRGTSPTAGACGRAAGHAAARPARAAAPRCRGAAAPSGARGRRCRSPRRRPRPGWPAGPGPSGPAAGTAARGRAGRRSARPGARGRSPPRRRWKTATPPTCIGVVGLLEVEERHVERGEPVRHAGAPVPSSVTGHVTGVLSPELPSWHGVPRSTAASAMPGEMLAQRRSRPAARTTSPEDTDDQAHPTTARDQLLAAVPPVATGCASSSSAAPAPASRCRPRRLRPGRPRRRAARRGRRRRQGHAGAGDVPVPVGSPVRLAVTATSPTRSTCTATTWRSAVQAGQHRHFRLHRHPDRHLRGGDAREPAAPAQARRA